MKVIKIPYSQTNQFSKLIIDYLANDKKLAPFINHFPSFNAFAKQIAEKQKHAINRSVLVEVLKEQKHNLSLSDNSQNNIYALQSKETFTVTTGHQLCLFTGPLYFIYKILSTINLAEQLKETFPQNKFVPVFWMASEDHDFHEINHIKLFGKRIEWESKQSGPVGRMNLDGLKNVIEELKSILGEAENANKLVKLFEQTFLHHDNLADATRYLVNELFGKYGLVIIDGDDKRLKQEFVPIIKKDLLENRFVNTIKECSDDLAKIYKAQAFVRDINFFRLYEGKRELIKGEIIEQEIENNPESFSPNVLLRPLYQETILPNIAYIGGGAEVAYCMQLKTAFMQENIPFPILVLRNSALIIGDKQKTKLENLGFEVNDLFTTTDKLKKRYALSNSNMAISLNTEKNELEKLYNKLLLKTNGIGLQESIKANHQKQLRSFEKLEQKLIRMEKQKHENAMNAISKIKQQLFPENSLQERHDNFIPFYLKDGDNFIEILKKSLNPLDANFVVLSN
ncbi:MAG: bacillithiol biosynthesis cysteine-adding enzyme BshC [Bacteroidota bacterium]|nr:bacillithiol biosynthesis cysteine-adding enzyme BshC [Bacteroidota bacterium]